MNKRDAKQNCGISDDVITDLFWALNLSYDGPQVPQPSDQYIIIVSGEATRLYLSALTIVPIT
jgi:hypothetical protein